MATSDEPVGWDDETLTQVIQQAKTGCTRSQEELFAQVQAYLTFIAREHFESTGKMGVSDIVQQSVIQAVENIQAFRGQSFDEFKGWLRQIVVNEAHQTRRRFAAEKRDRRRERSLERSTNDSTDGVDLADSLPTPGTAAMAEEDAAAIEAALSRLPEKYQQVIRLRNWDRLQFSEIAERMNMSVSGAAKLWYRALVELEQQYGAGNG